MTLTEAKEGQKLVVTATEGQEVTWHALRFGIGEGSQIKLEKKIPGGPVIISKNQLEIALGRHIAGSISVVPESEVKSGRR